MTPYVLCIDVGGPTKIGWADGGGRHGAGPELSDALVRAGALAASGTPVAIGFEAPIWTPRRAELARITGSRGGVEKRYNRAWSAGAGSGALGAALALMPWALTLVRGAAGSARATTDVSVFQDGRASVFIWEAFVSGVLKTTGLHHDDARLAVEAFTGRWPTIESDVPPEPAINHAAVAAYVAGFEVDPTEFGGSCSVVAVTPATVLNPTTA